MGSNVRRDDSGYCNFDEEDEEDDEENNDSIIGRIKCEFKKLLKQLHCLIPFIVVGILAVLIAFMGFSHYSRNTTKKITKNVDCIKDALMARLDDIEKAMATIAAACGAKIDSKSDEEASPEGPDPTEELIKTYIRKYDADKTGMLDFALESLGGSIVSTMDTESYVLGGTSVLGIPCSKQSSDPRSIIRPSTMPGDCWAFRGEGSVLIKLVTSVYITNFTVEHIASEMTPDGEVTSSPKLFLVYGYTGNKESAGHCFGHYEYKATGDPIQTFPVQNACYMPYDHVEFNFKSNNGNPEFTCVYRVRVHGHLTLEPIST